MFVLVAPFTGSFDDMGLTYYVPQSFSGEIQKGSVVIVPIRNRQIGAVVLDFIHENLVGDFKQIKEIIDVRSELILPETQLRLISHIAQNYFSVIHTSATLFFPKNLQEKILKNTVSKIKISQPSDTDVSQIDISLNQPQKKILDQINTSKNKNILFWGLTGSGKTHIYMEIARQNLLVGKQTLILVPEIILTNQISQRFVEVFGKENILEISSILPDAKKSEAWMEVYSGKPKIIIGTRSALFYPYTKLGSIIIDEEHDKSYDSDNGPRFNARDIALKIGEIEDIPVILASGTPSVKSLYRASKKEFFMVSLLERYYRE